MRFSNLIFKLFASFAAVALFALVPAQEEDEPPPAQEQPAKQLTKEEQVKAYEAAVKDLPKTTGAFTLYQRRKEVLVELTEADFDKPFFVQAAFATGGNYFGMQAGDPIGAQDVDLFTFQKQDGAVWLVRPNLKYRWSPDDPLALSASRSFPKAILGSYKIEAQNPDRGLYLVNITGLFHGGVFQISDIVNEGGGTYALDRDKCLVNKVKSFPENAVVRMMLHFATSKAPGPNPLLALLGLTQTSMLEDARSLPLMVTYNLWWRKDTGYMPRLMDDRVGYFTTDFFSIGKFYQADRKERYVNRFHLAKKDPKAKLSEPVKPIVWVIDNSVPPKYRSAIKKGILWWNEAFEEIGYKNAVQVIDQPDDPDYDHADGRYNVIRWTISPEVEKAYAIAQARTDPLTGEVLNAAVSIDANYVTAAFEQHKTLLDYTNPDEDVEAKTRKLLRKHGWSMVHCNLAEGLAESARTVWTALNALGVKVGRDEFANQLLMETVAHEVGHCLGLRHNFVGSTAYTTAQLGNPQFVRSHGHSASIMDYNQANVIAALKGHSCFFAPRLGVYDKWAIRWGYMEAQGATPTEEKHALSRVASQCGLPGLAYMTDETADSWDPADVRFDLAKDSLNFSSKMIYALRLNIRYACEKLPRPGESYQKRTAVIVGSINQILASCAGALPYIGGLNANRNHRGDAKEMPTLKPVDPSLQNAALQFILANGFAPDSLALPDKVLTSLSIDYDEEKNASWTAPLRKLVSLKLSALLTQMLQADRLSRIAENEQKLSGSGKAFPLRDYLSQVLRSVFNEIYAKKSIAPVRRDVQKFALSLYVNLAGAQADTAANDARAIAANLVSGLGVDINKALKSGKTLDLATRMHLQDLAAAISRFKGRRITVAR